MRIGAAIAEALVAHRLAGRRAAGQQARALLSEVGLDPAFVTRYPNQLSGGQRQRVSIARALSVRPRLLVLDEPTNGLDPQGIREIRDLLLRLNRTGTTIFLSSHLLAEVEQMCGRVGVIDRGRLVVQERLEVLRQPTGRLQVRTPDVARARSLLDGQVEAYDGHELLIRYADPAALNALLVREGVRVEMLAPERRSLEDVVLEATEAGSDRVARS